MFTMMGAMWGGLALAQLLECAIMGEKAIQTQAYAVRRKAVLWSRIALGWIVLLLAMVFIRAHA